MSVEMNQAKQAPKGMVTYRRLLGYALPHWSVLLLGILAMVVYAATEPSFSALIKHMMDDSFVKQDPDAIRIIPLLLIGLFIVRGIAGFVSTYCMNWVGRMVIKKMRREMFSKLLYMPTSYYDNNASGQIISKMTFNIEQVAQAATDSITIVVRDSLTAIGLLAWMFYLSGMLALIFLICGPFIAVVIVYVSKRFRRISTRIQDTMGEVTHVTQEVIDGHQVVKTFGGHEYEKDHFDTVNERNRRQQMKMVATTAISAPVIQLLAACALAGIIYLATSNTMRQITTVGDFGSFITAMLLLLPPLKRLTTVNNNIQRGIAAAQSIFELFDLEPEPDIGRHVLKKAKGELEFKNLSFSYKNGKGKVLDDVSFHVSPGETVALVGRSGSGKSTLVNLLPRFYEVDEGEILLDGVDIREYDRTSLREQIALVNQNVTLFNDTIARNIAYGSLGNTTTEDIIRAAEAAHAMEFIQELPEGLETVVGEDGVLLSGGQRQRIAIARALLKNAPVLIMDEATSALDTQSEYHVQAGLEQLMKERTTLVIAHRLSTVEKADNILVMKGGRIIESGTHAVLLQQNGHYASLYKMQFHEK
jgi:subfamily B ATP-binding cassette protein MsbA